jgi:hypothetical protein
VISAPNTAKDATPSRGSGMPSSGSSPSVVEPISSGMPMPVPSHGVWRVSAGDAPSRSFSSAAKIPADEVSTVNVYQSQ